MICNYCNILDCTIFLGQFMNYSRSKMWPVLLLCDWFKHSTVNHFHNWISPLDHSKPFKRNIFILGNCCHCVILINCWTIPKATSKTLKNKTDLYFGKEMRASMPRNNCFLVYWVISVIMRFSKLRTAKRPVSLFSTESNLYTATQPTLVFRLDPQ